MIKGVIIFFLVNGMEFRIIHDAPFSTVEECQELGQKHVGQLMTNYNTNVQDMNRRDLLASDYQIVCEPEES
jgi:hypothetical protein